jgi:uncharacterized protein YbaR (Trm112 family)
MSEISQELLGIICCPTTHQDLHIAPNDLLEVVRSLLCSRADSDGKNSLRLKNLELALVRADGKVIFLVCDGVPILLSDALINLRTDT